jgi:hypothetical protein
MPPNLTSLLPLVRGFFVDAVESLGNCLLSAATGNQLLRDFHFDFPAG